MGLLNVEYTAKLTDSQFSVALEPHFGNEGIGFVHGLCGSLVALSRTVQGFGVSKMLQLLFCTGVPAHRGGFPMNLDTFCCTFLFKLASLQQLDDPACFELARSADSESDCPPLWLAYTVLIKPAVRPVSPLEEQSTFGVSGNSIVLVVLS